MKLTKSQIAGWGLSILLAAFLIFGSALGKFTQGEGEAEMFAKMGWTEASLLWVGVVEVAIALLFLMPRSGVLGAILLTAYLGGATATHVRIADHFFFPIVMGILVWIALGLRRPGVFSLVLGLSPNNLKQPLQNDKRQ